MLMGSNHDSGSTASHKEHKRRVVYVSLEGMQEPLGQSQVLPYLRQLADRGHTFHLISFEKAGTPLRMEGSFHPNIRWTGLRFHQRPTMPARIFDVLQGSVVAWLTSVLRNADLVHARSYLPAMLLLPVVRLHRIPLLFDTRALWVDERLVVRNVGPDNLPYRFMKKVERQLFRSASAVTVLSQAMADYLRHTYPHRNEIRAPIRVIPTCTDLDRFRLEAAPCSELVSVAREHETLVYTGSFGPKYRAKEMARFYLAWRKYARSSRFLVISHQDPEEIREVLREAGAVDELVHRSARYDEVASYLRCARAAVAFFVPGLASLGACPTKLGEMLACGLPVAGNDVADMRRILGEGVGVMVESWTDERMDEAARQLYRLAVDGSTARKAQETAEKWFSLNRGVEAYDRLYQELAQTVPGGSLRDRGWPDSVEG
jgi:glycosyltransferase involved in cell wall biosynthesis